MKIILIITSIKKKNIYETILKSKLLIENYEIDILKNYYVENDKNLYNKNNIIFFHYLYI